MPDTKHYTVRVLRSGKTLLDYTPCYEQEPVPAPAEEIPAPENLETTERLFLAATHLEQ